MAGTMTIARWQAPAVVIVTWLAGAILSGPACDALLAAAIR
jgi:hypothetical protein